mmetsp:Transcript_29056/g.65798  ORF Transcript_29056/g.65798 Transcript_29056/m.65798 type:complete len:88 (+) Transcript_29056:300-563(+)
MQCPKGHPVRVGCCHCGDLACLGKVCVTCSGLALVGAGSIATDASSTTVPDMMPTTTSRLVGSKSARSSEEQAEGSVPKRQRNSLDL